jgi:hypothetical protein
VARPGDHQLPVERRVDPLPRVQQQVQALARELQTTHVDDVGPGLLRLVEQRGVDTVADHLDLQAGVDGPQLVGGVRRDGDDPAVAAHADGPQQVQGQVVLAALLPRLQPLHDADRRPPGPQGCGHAGERREEVLDDEVGAARDAVPADGGGQPEHVAEQPGQARTAAAGADVDVPHAVLDPVRAAGEPGGEDGDVHAGGGQAPVDLVRAQRAAAGARHGRVLEAEVQHAQRPVPPGHPRSPPSSGVPVSRRRPGPGRPRTPRGPGRTGRPRRPA